MQNIIKKYRVPGFKLTPQRLAIIKYLEGNTSHPTAEDILINTRKNYPTISFATVYNTVQTLKERGEIAEITIDPAKKHFDPNTTPHHHIICEKCKGVADVFADYSTALKLPDEVLSGYTITGNHVDFFGICAKCSADDAAE